MPFSKKKKVHNRNPKSYKIPSKQRKINKFLKILNEKKTLSEKQKEELFDECNNLLGHTWRRYNTNFHDKGAITGIINLTKICLHVKDIYDKKRLSERIRIDRLKKLSPQERKRRVRRSVITPKSQKKKKKKGKSKSQNSKSKGVIPPVSEGKSIAWTPGIYPIN